MEQFKGTKGIWIAESNPYFNEVHLSNAKVRMEIHVHLFDVSTYPTVNISLSDEGKANAQVISKAPQLVEELIECLETINIISKSLATYGSHPIIEKRVAVATANIKKLLKEATEI